MRISEILALTEKDFDFDNNFINIDKTLSYCREYNQDTFKYIIKSTSPKSKNSIRIVYFPKNFQKDLKAFIKYIKMEYFKKGVKYTPNSILFISPNFKYSWLNGKIAHLNKVYKKYGINHTGFHVLIHTYISKIYKSGINQKIIQEQVGHSNLNMTLHYTHVENVEKYNSAQNLNLYF